MINNSFDLKDLEIPQTAGGGAKNMETRIPTNQKEKRLCRIAEIEQITKADR